MAQRLAILSEGSRSGRFYKKTKSQSFGDFSTLATTRHVRGIRWQWAASAQSNSPEGCSLYEVTVAVFLQPLTTRQNAGFSFGWMQLWHDAQTGECHRRAYLQKNEGVARRVISGFGIAQSYESKRRGDQPYVLKKVISDLIS